jgi:hypothetical protein
MRVGLVLAGVSLLVAIVAACSSFSGEDPAPADAGAPEAGAEAGIDAALPPTPGSIDCFGSACNKAQGAVCCVDIDAGTNSCANVCAIAKLTFRCDDGADCAPGEHCCVGFFGDAKCALDCGETSERLCHADGECEPGTTCVQVPCRGTVIGTCGPVRGYVKGFCSPDAG